MLSQCVLLCAHSQKAMHRVPTVPACGGHVVCGSHMESASTLMMATQAAERPHMLYADEQWERSRFTTVSQDLWLNDNRLEDFHLLLDRVGEVGGTLTCLYAANNPATSNAGEFRRCCLRVRLR